MSSKVSASQASAKIEMAINCTNQDCQGWMVNDASIPSYKRLKCHFVCPKAHVTQEQKDDGKLPLKCGHGWKCINPECFRAHYGEDGPDVNICPSWFKTNECDDGDECQYAHPKEFYKAKKSPSKVRRRKKKPQELTDEDFEAMGTVQTDEPKKNNVEKSTIKKAGGRFAALEESVSPTDNELERFTMTTPVNVPADLPEVKDEHIVLNEKNYTKICPELDGLTWEQVKEIAKKIGATIGEKQAVEKPIRVVKPKAVVEDEFPSLGAAVPVKKKLTGQWGNQDMKTRNAKWKKDDEEKAALEAEKKKRAEEEERRLKKIRIEKEKAARAEAAKRSATIMGDSSDDDTDYGDGDDGDDGGDDDGCTKAHPWWS
jgi:hypothetical protein